MSRETVEMIRRAEAQANEIRAEAVRRAANMQECAEADGKRFCEQTEQKTAEEFRRVIADMQSKAEALTKKIGEESAAEAVTLRMATKQKKHSAAKYIVRGIME